MSTDDIVFLIAVIMGGISTIITTQTRSILIMVGNCGMYYDPKNRGLTYRFALSTPIKIIYTIVAMIPFALLVYILNRVGLLVDFHASLIVNIVLTYIFAGMTVFLMHSGRDYTKFRRVMRKTLIIMTYFPLVLTSLLLGVLASVII